MKAAAAAAFLAVAAAAACRGAAGGESPAQHVLTGMHQLCYDAPCFQPAQRIPLARLSRWISWANADRRVSDQARKLGIRTYAYVDPSVQYDPQRDYAPLYSEDESTFLHGCGGSRATVQFGELQGYLMDQGATSYRARVRSYIDREIRGRYDALFVDDVFASVDTFLKVTQKPCDRTFEVEREKTFGLWRDLDMPVIFNGLGNAPDDGRTDAFAQRGLDGPSAIGGMYEFCLSYDGNDVDHTVRHKRVDGAWLSAENSHLETVARGKLFFCYAGSGTPGATPAGIDERLYVYASFLLVYHLDRSVLEMSTATTPSRVPVFPESQLIAADPVRPQPNVVNGLLEKGVYQREYRHCRLSGREVGGCVALVNPSASSSATVRLEGYHHALALHGGALPDGGSASADGSMPTVLAPATGTILFR